MRFSEETPGGLSLLQRAGWERQTSLLASLPVGDLAGKICVEYGANGSGAEGEHLALADGSVDVFFAYDALERVDDTERLLDEVHRVLKPDGLLVATATNAAAYLFARNGEQHGVSPERPGLMAHDELRRIMERRFAVLVARGFNSAIHSTLDARVGDVDFARAWVEQLTEHPELATDAVLLARGRADYRPRRTVTRSVSGDDPAVERSGPWERATLHATLYGYLGTGDEATLTLPFDGTDLVILFWSHSWSGHAWVEVDGVTRELVDLYSRESGIRRVHVRGLASGTHELRIRGSRVRNPRSSSSQVIFCKAIAYDGGPTADQAEERTMDTDMNFRTRPSRFGVVYTTPAHMTAPERVLLYGVVFGTRPQRVLEVGTFRGGSALVIAAALDDVGAGTLVCVDPAPQVAPEHWAQIAHRATMLAGPSPDVLPQALEVAGGPFDFALIDGDHEYAGVVRDIEGVLPFLAPAAHLLFHDAHYFEVREAIDKMLFEHADCLTDCGMMSTESTPEDRSINGQPIVWGGLRMLRYHRPR